MKGRVEMVEENNVNVDETNENNVENNENVVKDEKITFENQKTFDAVVSRRIAKALKAENEKRENEKRQNELSEKEKLKLQMEETEKRAIEKEKAANTRLIKAEVKSIASNLDIIDPTAAYKLLDKDDIEVDEKGDVVGVEKALKLLIAEKPWLLKQNTQPAKTGDDTKNNKSNNPLKSNGNDFNSIIRQARQFK
jgi:ribosomal protein L11